MLKKSPLGSLKLPSKAPSLNEEPESEDERMRREINEALGEQVTSAIRQRG